MASDEHPRAAFARRLAAPAPLRAVTRVGPPLRVVVVVATRVLRDALVARLAADPHLDVVAAEPPGPTAVARVAELDPDLVVVDMTAADSAAVCRRVAARPRSPRVVGLGVADDERDLARCRFAGVVTHVPASATVDDLVAALMRVDAAAVPPGPRATVAAEPLTTREQEVALLLAERLSNRAIAARLGISVSTVKNHVHHVLGKLGVADRTEVADRVPPPTRLAAVAPDGAV